MRLHACVALLGWTSHCVALILLIVSLQGNDAFPIGGQGVLIELVQAPAAVIAALG